MDVYGHADMGVKQKDDKSPLTKADLAANEIICNHLQKVTPAIPIISEEMEVPAYEIRKEYKQYWLIDPLDGTKEFIKRNGEFTTNIALIEDGVPIAGFVYVPVKEEMYWAVSGKGAFKKTATSEEKINARVWDSRAEDIIVTCSRSHLSDDTMFYINEFVNPQLLKVGSSLKLVLIAEGKADVYPRLNQVSEWDVAAAHAILIEAGGSLYQFPSEEPVVYNNRPSILMPHFVAEGVRKTIDR
ncbi:UNVERIFIED_CONTAM: hypothetical protein GTU68_061457 [Idotea baltica]|nr:hypothetical protein [Idotea baltica]